MQKFLLLLVLLVPALSIAEPLRVFASVVPIQTFIAKVGGKHVDARAMVRPGFNPHTYDPTPQQISALASATLYVRTGVPFEKAWMERIRSANPQMQILDARGGIALREMEAHDHEEHGHKGYGHDEHTHKEHGHDEHGDEQDPHVWTNPLLVTHMVGRIRDKLSELAPAHAADFARNHDALVAELDALDAELHALLGPLPNRKFMVFHPAWGVDPGIDRARGEGAWCTWSGGSDRSGEESGDQGSLCAAPVRQGPGAPGSKSHRRGRGHC